MDVEIKTPVGNINVNMTQDNIKKLLDFAYENAVIESNDSDINKQETVPKESEENSGGYSNGRSCPKKRIMYGEKKSIRPDHILTGTGVFYLSNVISAEKSKVSVQKNLLQNFGVLVVRNQSFLKDLPRQSFDANVEVYGNIGQMQLMM